MSCDKFLERDMKYQKRIIFNVVKELDIMKGEITAIFDNSDYLYYSIFISFTLSKNDYMINIIYFSNFFVLSKSTRCMKQLNKVQKLIVYLIANFYVTYCDLYIHTAFQIRFYIFFLND